jgi:prophage tail gpP-like protein
MPKAVPGGTYVIVQGDTLWGIAGQAYGNVQRWPEIWEANKSTLSSGDPNLIFPGEVLFIPGDKPLVIDVEDDSELLPGPEVDPNGVILTIDGQEVKVEAARVLRTMDTGSDKWSAEVYWDPDNAELTDLYRPYKYKEAKAYVGGQLLVTGPLMVPEPSVTNDKVSMNLEGFSSTIDMVDSHLNPPYEYAAGMTLNQIANELASKRGITVVDETEALGVFGRITAERSDKEFEFLAKLAKQKGALLTSTPKGYLLITKTAGKKDLFGSIGDDQARGHDWRARFDGRQRFRQYRVIGKRRGKNVNSITVVDDVVPKSRTLNISAGDLVGAELEQAANWEKSKRIADALTIPFPVSDWYAPDGRLWRENKYVTVVSARIFVPQGFDFLIRSVEYIYGPDGRKSILSLVPPGVFTGEPVEEPWL